MTPISLYLLRKHGENRLLVWAALIILTAGLSGLQVGLEKLAIPYMDSLESSESLLKVMYFASSFLNIIVHAFPYYLILIYFIHFAGYAQGKTLNTLLLIPVLLSFIFTDVYSTSQMNYSYILSWGIPYMLASILLFVRGILTAENEIIKKLQYFGIGMIILIPEIFLLLLQLEGTYIQFPIDILILIPILCLISLLFGLIFFVYNVFTRFQASAVLTKMQLGTSLMQHAFKNAISKNKLHALNMQRSLEGKHYEVVDDHLRSLLRSNEHLMNMVSKLSYLTQSRLSAELKPTDISLLLDELIDQFHYTSVSLEKNYSSEIVNIDRTLIAECFTNIINNAIEAMNCQGKITITIEKGRRHIKIHFSDTGKGMNKEQINNMFEPFYSTKHKTGQNFGLGMFHAKKIINAHRGKIKVVSQPTKGTTISIILAKTKKLQPQ